MIKIRKGSQILTVPQSSYKEFYRVAGWSEIEEKPTMSPWEKKVKSSSMNELKELAREKGIDTAGVSKKTLIATLLKS